MAEKKIDGSSSEEGVQDHQIQAGLSEKYKDELLGFLASKAAERKRISEKNIVDLSMMAGNVKLKQGAESTGSDSKGEGDGGEEKYLFLNGKEGHKAFAREFKKILEEPIPDDDGKGPILSAWGSEKKKKRAAEKLAEEEASRTESEGSGEEEEETLEKEAEADE